jgi:hypothetical protein
MVRVAIHVEMDIDEDKSEHHLDGRMLLARSRSKKAGIPSPYRLLV